MWHLICISRCGLRTLFCFCPGLSANVSVPWRAQPRARRRLFTFWGEYRHTGMWKRRTHTHTNAGLPSCAIFPLTDLPQGTRGPGTALPLRFPFDTAPRWAPRNGRLCRLFLAVILPHPHPPESLLCFNAAGTARAADVCGWSAIFASKRPGDLSLYREYSIIPGTFVCVVKPVLLL